METGRDDKEGEFLEKWEGLSRLCYNGIINKLTFVAISKPKLNTKPIGILIKDMDDLFLMFDINRSSNGDIYVNGNEREFEERKNKKHFHWSKHKSGQHHSKSSGHLNFPQKPKTQPPDDNFKGSEVIVGTGIRKGYGRAWNNICRVEDFSEVMIIEDCIITPEFGYKFDIEIVEPGIQSRILADPYSIIIQQQTFKDKAPWFVASLYQTYAEKIR